jgi:hypothetical protein
MTVDSATWTETGEMFQAAVDPSSEDRFAQTKKTEDPLHAWVWRIRHDRIHPDAYPVTEDMCRAF